jgi:hypothetical protein
MRKEWRERQETVFCGHREGVPRRTCATFAESSLHLLAANGPCRQARWLLANQLSMITLPVHSMEGRPATGTSAAESIYLFLGPHINLDCREDVVVIERLAHPRRAVPLSSSSSSPDSPSTTAIAHSTVSHHHGRRTRIDPTRSRPGIISPPSGTPPAPHSIELLPLLTPVSSTHPKMTSGS